jgi:type IV secretion system protein VirB10
MDQEEGLLSPAEDEDQQFETTPEQATAMEGGAKPGLFNRKRVLMALCISFSVVICGGLLLNTLGGGKKKTSSAELDAARVNSQADKEFLASLQNSAVRRRIAEQSEQVHDETPVQEEEKEPEPLLPSVSLGSRQEADPRLGTAPSGRTSAPPPPAQNQYPQSGGSGGGQQQQETHFKSSLVPQVQGRQFAQAQQPPQAQAASASSPGADYFNSPYSAGRAAPSYGSAGRESNYAAQNNQENKQAFYDSSNGGAVLNGQYLGDNSIWTGTIIPGVLETAINTDLPGNVLARVTQNVYDSRTGRNLLIPQGTLLVARYNSSVSYAQSRVQIVWDTLIRPDGYQIDMEGAPGVDRAGMSGQAAQYNEHWFEYIKAAGIVTLFSIANSKMTETAAQYASGDAAANIAAANSEVVNQLSGSMAGRAMDIQPTLTVEQGTRINIMLNKTLYLPSVSGYPANQKYTLE